MSQALKTVLNQFHTLNESEFLRFAGIGTPMQFKKKEHLFRAGDFCAGIYFVEQGALRLYELRDGKEIHRGFFLEGQFASDIAGLRSREASKVNLAALEDASVYYLPRDDMLTLYEESQNFAELGRKILAQKLLRQQELSGLLLSLTPSERYQHILDHRPELVRRVPLQYLATYLGMTRETLSRIRGKME